MKYAKKRKRRYLPYTYRETAAKVSGTTGIGISTKGAWDIMQRVVDRIKQEEEQVVVRMKTHAFKQVHYRCGNGVSPSQGIGILQQRLGFNGHLRYNGKDICITPLRRFHMTQKKKTKARLEISSANFRLLVAAILAIAVLVITIVAFILKMEWTELLNTIVSVVTLFTFALSLSTWLKIQSLRSSKPVVPALPTMDTAIVIISIGNIVITDQVIAYCNKESSRYRGILSGAGFRNPEAFHAADDEIKNSGYTISCRGEDSRVVVLSRKQIENEHVPDTAEQIYQAFGSLEQALHINGISNLHLFYMGPVVVPFYIGELLSNRLNVYIYKYEKGTYEFSGLMNHLDYMR